MSELRLVLDVAVSPRNQMSAKHALPGLESVLDRITPRDRPRLVRGDCGFGNEATLVVCESREVDYLFRLRLSSNVKKFIARLHFKDGWLTADCGYEVAPAIPLNAPPMLAFSQKVLAYILRERHNFVVISTSFSG